MNAEKVDVGDEVIITYGDWKGQRGRIEGKFDMTVAGVGEPKKALLTIRLASGGAVQKSNTAIEPAPTP